MFFILQGSEFKEKIALHKTSVDALFIRDTHNIAFSENSFAKLEFTLRNSTV